MFLKSIDLTTALRPSYLPDEVLLFVQDNVGLYEGYATSAHNLTVKNLLHGRERANRFLCRKYKIPDYQNGSVYLTSHRICYVDNEDPRKNSIAIDLKDVDRYEFYVCGRDIIYLPYADHKIGRFLEILCKDYSRPKASETILSAEPNHIKSEWPI
jgi:hypothetical protein